MGLAPSAAGRPPPPPPCDLGPLPPHQPGPPPPGALQKEPSGGWGEEGRRGRGGKGFGLREGSSNYNGGWGGDPPNTSWGQTHIWGLPTIRVALLLLAGITLCSKNSLSGADDLIKCFGLRHLRTGRVRAASSASINSSLMGSLATQRALRSKKSIPIENFNPGLKFFNPDRNFRARSKSSIPEFLFPGPRWCTEKGSIENFNPRSIARNVPSRGGSSIGERFKGQHDLGQQGGEPLRGKSASKRVSEREGFQRFLEGFRRF